MSACARHCSAARQVGLGYLVLRQPGYALSGGEAQRLKIAQELLRQTAPGTLYILDEPTVGQHLDDVQRLVGVLHRLVDAGRLGDGGRAPRPFPGCLRLAGGARSGRRTGRRAGDRQRHAAGC